MGKRGRPSTGGVEWHNDHWDIRLTRPDGKKAPRMCQPASMDKQAAQDRAKHLNGIVRAEALPMSPASTAAPVGETFSAWAERWHADRETRGHTSVKDDRGRLSKWVEPSLGKVPMRAITRTDLEKLVEVLDARVRAGELGWKTARNVWSVVRKAFVDASCSKTLALRVMKENITVGIVGPDAGEQKSKVYLYPNELLAIAICPRVPIRWRRLFALAAYTYTRAGELEALEWADVDFDAMRIHVHQAIDRSDGEVKCTKSNNPRRVPIEPALLPLLQVLHDEREGAARVVAMPSLCDLSKRLRKYAAWAGLKRPELLAGAKTRKALTFHDLRATGVTWRAIRGDEPLKIMAHAGHKDLKTTMGYVREAESVGPHAGPPFPELPASVIQPGIQPEGAQQWGQLGGKMRQSMGVPSGIRKLGRALKAHDLPKKVAGSRSDSHGGPSANHAESRRRAKIRAIQPGAPATAAEALALALQLALAEGRVGLASGLSKLAVELTGGGPTLLGAPPARGRRGAA